MRFDLTQASFRVLERAGLYVLPDSPSEITAAKVLLALLEEEGCRAADWLEQEGITLESFCADFGIESTVVEFPAEEDSGNLRSNPSAKRYSVCKNYLPAEYRSNTQSKVRFYLDDQFVKMNRIAKELETALEIIAAQCNQSSLRQGKRRKVAAYQGILSVSTLDGDFITFEEPLATEHLLLAAAMDENDVGQCLRDHNLEPTVLFDRIAKQNQKAPLDAMDSDSLLFKQRDPVAYATGYQVVATSYQAVSRLIDAAANRARESCRVIEDYARFILNQQELTQTLKSFRHRLQKILSELPLEELLAARDTRNDIGTSLEAEGEYQRNNSAEVLSANFSRLQESLRTLEEFTKVETPSLAKPLEQLRYESYTLHKELFGLHENPPPEEDGKNQISEALLYILLDCRKDAETFTEMVDMLISGGADAIQLRDKTADDRTLLERGKLLRRLIDSSTRKPLFIMNDRPDLAVLVSADGVHVGQDELPVREVRKIVGSGKFIGVSTHSIEQIQRAVSDGADYIGVGPVFLSETKTFLPEQLVGLELLRAAVAEEIPIPMFAVGGITPDTLDEVLQTGVKCIAVSSGGDTGKLNKLLPRLRQRSG